MNKRLICLLASFCFLLISNTAFAYRWPFADAVGPHPIAGTMGEFRTTPNRHLHNGVDMVPNGGAQINENATKIYAIEGCDGAVVDRVRTNSEYVACGSFAYVHVQANIRNGTQIRPGQEIAQLKDLGEMRIHLHLTENGGNTNPLHQGGFDNYADTDRTYVYSLDFYNDGLQTPITQTDEEGRIILSGKVGILSQAKDDQSLGSDTVAPYLIGYLIKDDQGSVVANATNILFSSTYGYIANIYDIARSDLSTYYYWVANNMTGNNAINTESFPDGRYSVTVFADDIIGDQVGPKKYNIETSQGAMTRNVVIRNLPYVSSTTPTNNSFNVATTSNITISFNKAMDIASVQAAISSTPDVTSAAAYIWSPDGKTVTLAPSPALSATSNYAVTISDYAKDAQGNQLDGNKDGAAGGSYTFTFSTKKASINITGITHEYADGATYWVKAGTKNVTVQLVDNNGNAILANTPPQLKWTSPKGTIRPVNFTATGTSSQTWTGTIAVTSGDDGNATFTGVGAPVSGITSFMIDTKPPKVKLIPNTMPSCNCPTSPVAFKYDATDEGSGIGTIVPVGLGMSVSGCYEPGTYQYGASSIKDKVGNSLRLTKNMTLGTPPGCDHPDDNYAVSGALSPETGSGNPSPGAFILQGGFDVYLELLLNKTKQDIASVSLDDLMGRIMNSDKLMVIPSAALYGLENSSIVKAQISEFVKQGGTLLVFAQQHGYEFSVLPVPQEADGTYKTIAGYGWQEDQSCQHASVYIDTWHQMFSGLANAVPSLNVDGYFTNYPSNTTVLLRRTVNSQPAMIMYDYGQGKVIATSMYSDFAYGYGQASSEEIALVRDMITWAKAPAELPEVKAGGSLTVSLPLTVFNGSSSDAATVKLLFKDPNRSMIMCEQLSDLMLPSGQTTSLPASCYSSVNDLGIYHVDYTLFDALGNEIQLPREAESGRFAVSEPPINSSKSPDFNFSINTNSEQYAAGSDAIFTVTMWNNTDVDRNIIASSCTYHLNISGASNCYEKVNGSPIVTPVPAHSSASIQLTATDVASEGWLVTRFSDEAGAQVGVMQKGIWLYNPSVDVSAITDKAFYSRGETVNVSIDLQNRQSVGFPITLKLHIADSANIAIYTYVTDISLLASSASVRSVSFVPPISALGKYYTVSVEIFDSAGKKIGGTSTPFEVHRSLVTVKPIMPVAFSLGENTIPFVVSNIGKLNVSTGLLDIIFKDPDGLVLYTGVYPFTLEVGENKTINASVSIQSLKFGSYSLSYSQSDETRAGSRSTVNIANSASMSLSFDKPSYRVRETANISVDILNVGKFTQDNITVSVSVPDAGYADSRTISIKQGQVLPLQFSIPIPETLLSGQHSTTVSLSLPSGGAVVQTAKLTVPEAVLAIGHSGSNILSAGDSTILMIQNTGGVDSMFATDKLQLLDSTGVVLYRGSVSGTIRAGEVHELAVIPIPSQVVQGIATLTCHLKNLNTSEWVYLSKKVEIMGLSAALQAQTDKDLYFNTEEITGLFSVKNDVTAIDGAHLNITVTQAKNEGAGPFTHYLPKERWGPFVYPSSVAVGPDDSLYVAEFYRDRILKFDGSGNYVLKWGSHGKEDGQFYAPNGIAIDAEGFVYVSDYSNCRVQKFDKNGLFVLKWGGCGSEDGQIIAPRGIVIKDSKIYLVDGGNNRIQVFDLTGSYLFKFGTRGDGYGQFNGPIDIVVDNEKIYVLDNYVVQTFDLNGNYLFQFRNGDLSYQPSSISIENSKVYVSIVNKHNVQVFDTDGKYLFKFGSKGEGNGQLIYPYGVDVMKSKVYVADNGNDRVQIFDLNGNYLSKISSRGSDNGQFNYPEGMCVASDGSLYVADYNNHRIQVFDVNGNFLKGWGSYGNGDGQFQRPIAVAIGPDNSVYVVDRGNNRIQKFDGNGNFMNKWGELGFAEGQFYYPNGIAAAPDGSVYVADKSNNRIQKFDSNGIFRAQWRGFYDPHGVAVGADGFVYVADTGNNRIKKLDNNGNLITQWGNYCEADENWDGIAEPSCEGQFYLPFSIAVGPDGYVYVADSGNNRIQRFDSNGTFITKWGGYGDENGQFYWPEGIAVGADNSVYIADTNNHRIQRMAGGNERKILFETVVPIAQSGDSTQDYTTDIGALNATGKLYLQAELKNSIGQLMAAEEYPFFVVTGNTALLYSTDKKYYKPNETVLITGEVRNLASTTASNLILSLVSQQGTQQSQLYSTTFDIPAGGKYPFTLTTNSDSEGEYTLSGKVTHNTSTLAEVMDGYKVEKPKVTATVTAPEMVGNGSFSMDVELKNEGITEAVVGLLLSAGGQPQSVTVPAGETRLIQFSQQINGATEYTFTFSGDLNQSISKAVVYGLGASIQVGAQGEVSSVHPEGRVSIPVTIVNTGPLDESVTVDYALNQAFGDVVQQSINYYIPKNGSSTDILYFDLAEGNYQFTAMSSLPTASATVSLNVLKEKSIDLLVTVGEQVNELIPVTFRVKNQGYKDISCGIQYEAIDKQGAVVWSGYQDVVRISSQETQVYSVIINSSTIQPGDYTLKAAFLDNDGQQLATRSAEFGVRSASFEITQYPLYQSFNAGQKATFTFKVKNTGSQEGAAQLALKAYDLIDTVRTEWLKPGEEKEMVFSFMFPDDLEEKDYYADYTLTPVLSKGGDGAVRGQVKYHLAGINIGVTASLDKQYYSAGDTARLTLTVNQQSSADSQSLFARINYNGFETQQLFTLAGNQVVIFDIPLAQISGDKLFYGIYHAGGRSIHLNSVYIYKGGEALSIITDKKVYNPGDVVDVEITSQESEIVGKMTITGPGGYSEAFEFVGSAAKSIPLPAAMTAGTYNITVQMIDAKGLAHDISHPIDVNGIQVKIIETRLDRGKYAETDTISASLTITSNTDLSGTIKTWVVDPKGIPTPAGESAITLFASEPLLKTHNSKLITASLGIHRLVYVVYSGDLLLSAGSEAFDVGDAVLLGIAMDKSEYLTNAEAPIITASMLGSVDAKLELQLDGASVSSEQVMLDGFAARNIDLGTVSPGMHVLKAVLTAGGLSSVKETNFIYGSKLPDLTAEVRVQTANIGQDSTMQIAATITNEGKEPAAGTSVSLYDGGNLIETKSVRVLNAGEYDVVTFSWNALGKAGEHTLTASVDPDNYVSEFNEGNNIGTTSAMIPNLAVVTRTDKDTYKIRQKVYITSSITNLTVFNSYGGLSLTTTAKDAGGKVVFTGSTDIGALQPSSSTATTDIWNTTGLAVDGIYTITQTVTAGAQLIAQNTILIALESAPDFTLTADVTSRRIKQGEQTMFTASLTPINGWSREASMVLEGLPSGASITFSPDKLLLPGQVQTVVITTSATEIGIHSLYLTAQGIDEGEIVTHTVPLTLDITGYGLTSEKASMTVKQLETATFPIRLTALNGYEGSASLSVAGLPQGTKATLVNPLPSIPGASSLVIKTSKYAKAGVYTITVSGNDGLASHSMNVGLVIQPNPAIAPGIIATQGAGPQSDAIVRLYNSDLQMINEFAAFNTKYGANAVSADIDGDGYDEVIVAQGPDPKNTATLRGFKRDGSFVVEFTPFDTKYGLTLSAADLDGDWVDEIIAGMGPDPKNPGVIKIIKYINGGFTDVTTKTVHPDGKYGVAVAAGDVDGDGIPEIITAPGSGPNNPALIKVWKFDTAGLSENAVFTAIDGTYGVNIAVADMDGDGKAKIITGAGPDPRNTALITIFRPDGAIIGTFSPYDANYGYGVNVSVGDINGDGISEIIAGPGPGRQNESFVKIFKSDGIEVNSFLAYPAGTGYGVKVSGGRTGK